MAASEMCGKLLPNLKITFNENKSCSEYSLEAGEILEDVKTVQESTSTTKHDWIKNWVETMDPPKYKKENGFETGIDLSSNELIKKLENRANRFGLDKNHQKPITKFEIDGLYKSFGLNPDNLGTNAKNIRLDAIHVRGVNKMNTKEVTNYFKDYGPSFIEWINDISCNVCWKDPVSAARAMLGMSQPIVNKSKQLLEFKEQSDLETCDKNKSCKKLEVLDSEKDNLLSKNEKIVDIEFVHETLADESMEVDLNDSLHDSEIETTTKIPDVPIPPGCWRLGRPHPKAKALLLRFATKDDKKLPKAESNSLYYLENGNPNYGGMKGIISTSRKRKYNAMHTRKMVEHLSGKTDTYDNSSNKYNLRRIKEPRMKMYADEEEEKIKRSSKRKAINPKNIKSRLGDRFTRDDLHNLGPKFSFDEQYSDEVLSVTCKIPSRFNIWTQQAKAMAEEEGSYLSPYRNSSYNPDRELEDKNYEDLDEGNSSRYCAYDSERASFEKQKQLGYKNYSGEDLRNTLNSSRKKTTPKSDLRLRIHKLKDEDLSHKHRSPLCRDSDSD